MPEPQWTSAQKLFASMLAATEITVEEIEQVLQDQGDYQIRIFTFSEEEEETFNLVKAVADINATVNEQTKFILQLQGAVDRLTSSLNAQKSSRSRKKTNE